MRRIFVFESDALRALVITARIFRMMGSFQRNVRTIQRFLNCHRGYCVNLNHIHALRKDGCVLDNQEAHPGKQRNGGRVQEEI